jgi:hypothetical protein
MNPSKPVILKAAKDPAAQPQRASFWILRFAQNDSWRGLRFTLALSVSLLALRALAAPPVDLGGELTYLRVHSLVAERDAIVAALNQARTLVLDLRYPVDERDASDSLRQALSAPAVQPRLFVLVSPATSVPIAGVLAAAGPKLVTLGVKGSHPEPQVGVMQTAADDRRAFDALANGTSLADLISGKIDKERFDEAALVQDFKNGNPEAHPPEAGPAKATEPPARLLDRVLQRAVHLQRALQALQR